MGSLRFPLVLIVILSIIALSPNIISIYVGPLEYKGHITYAYAEGDSPISNVVFSFDEEIRRSILITDAPTSWSIKTEERTLIASGGSLAPGDTLVIGISFKKYIPPGEKPFIATGTTTEGESVVAQGILIVSEMILLKIIYILADNLPLLLVAAIILLVIDVVLPRRKLKQIGTPDEQDVPDVDQGLDFPGQEGMVYPIDSGDGGVIPPSVLERWETCCRDKWEELNKLRKTLPRREKKIADLEKQRNILKKEVNDLEERRQTCENEYNELKDQLENMSYSWYGETDEQNHIEKRAKYDKLKERRKRALREKKTELDQLSERLKRKQRDLKNGEGSLSYEKLEFETALLVELDLFKAFVKCRLSHRPVDRITQLVNKWNEIEKVIANHESRLKNIPEQKKKLTKEIADKEEYYEDLVNMIDGSSEGHGIYMHSTDVKREIAEMKKQLEELDNLKPYYEDEIKKLKKQIVEIRKEINRSGIYD